MKRLFFILSLCLMACQNPAERSMSLEEEAMIGDWNLKRTEYLTSEDSVFMVQNHTNFTSCHLYLKEDSSPLEGLYVANVGLTCLPQESQWRAADSTLVLGTGWSLNILYVDGDSLILRYGSPAYNIYYLSKT